MWQFQYPHQSCASPYSSLIDLTLIVFSAMFVHVQRRVTAQEMAMCQCQYAPHPVKQ